MEESAASRERGRHKVAATVDTHREVKNLVGAGFEESHAEAVVGTVMAGRAGLATKADLDLLRTEWRADLELLRAEFRADLELLRAEFRADLRELKLELIKWLGGTTIAMIGIAVAALSLILG